MGHKHKTPLTPEQLRQMQKDLVDFLDQLDKDPEFRRRSAAYAKNISRFKPGELHTIFDI